MEEGIRGEGSGIRVLAPNPQSLIPNPSSAGRETLSGSSPRVDGLVQFEQIMAAKRSGEQGRLARRAVDELLAAGQL